MVTAIVTLFYSLFIFQGFHNFFTDSDAGWHIRTGESILRGEGLPRTDPYSFTRPAQPWFAWEWGADILMGAAHSMAGLAGVALLYAVAIAVGVWVWFRLHWRLGGNFFLACGMAALLMSTANIHWLARPHVLGWIFVLLTVWYAEAGIPRLWPVVVAGAMWANLHASFPLGWVMLLIYAAGAWLRPVVWEIPDDRNWKRFTAAAALAVAGSFVNPYGWRLHRHIFSYLQDGELLHRVNEFQSFDFHREGAGYIIATLGFAVLGGILSLGQREPARFLLTALLVAWALRSARGLPIVAFALLPPANAAITEALSRACGLRPGLRRRLDGFLRYSSNLALLDSRWHGAALIPAVIVACAAMLRLPGIAAQTGFPPDIFPVTAASHLPQEARVLATDRFGGYLIYRFAGARKVFFDGRSDFYGADFLKRYGRLFQLRPGWRDELQRYGFTHALLANDQPLVEALEQLGWRRIYRDGTATLLVATTT